MLLQTHTSIRKKKPKSESFLARSQELAHIGSWLLESPKERLIWSDELYRIFGFKHHEPVISAEKFLGAIHPDDLARRQAAYAESLRIGKDGYVLEFRIVRTSSSETRWVYEKCFHERDETGVVIRSIGMIQDITERKEAERQRNMSLEILETLNREENFRTAADHLIVSIQREIGIEAVGIRIAQEKDFHYYAHTGFPPFFVDAKERLCSYRSDGVLELGSDGKPLRECTCSLVLQGLADPTNPLFSPGGSAWTNDSSPFAHTFSGTSLHSNTCNLCLREGYRSVALIPIRSGTETVGLLQLNDRRPDRFSAETIALLEGIAMSVGIAFDRHRTAVNLRQSMEQLFHAQKLESVGLLAGGVAHDFNNMLQVILGYVELTRESDLSPRKLHEILVEIGKAAQRSANLTRQLLTFARKQVIAPKVLDLNETISDMLTMLRRLIGENIELLWRPAKKNTTVMIDPSQLDQILANLAVNARDAIAGVGSLVVESGRVTLDEAYCACRVNAAPGDYVTLSVSDTGCGMDAETLAHIFEPFFTTKSNDKGTGLGLATVYGIVSQHKGFLNVHSERGKGTTFTIFLPFHQKPAETHTPAVPTAIADSDNKTVLVVEDEHFLLKVLTRMLKNLGYRVLATDSSEQALRLAEQNAGTINLLLTDVVMPRMNGYDLSQKMTALYPDVKCLYMSGCSVDTIADLNIFSKGLHFISKPFSTHTLAEKLREALCSP